MPVNPNDHVPIYEQIVEHICGSVTAGVFCPGEVLPSIRALALELVVNPNTVQRAYQELERLGLVQMRKGLGVFVAKNGGTSARRRTEGSVRDRFTQGIDVGRAARIANAALETIFREALNGGADPPNAGATGGSPASAGPRNDAGARNEAGRRNDAGARNEAKPRNDAGARNEAKPGDQASPPPDSRSKS